jgi:hypothetical protein
MSLICILKILSNPRLNVAYFREWITSWLLASIKLREANAKADFVYVCIRYDVISSGGNGWVNKEFNETLGSECPALGVAVDKGL